MSLAEKNTYHHGNLRQALMDEALTHIRENGAEKLSLRALARSLGVSQAAPYRHFQDKVALLSALASDGFERLSEQMHQGADQNPNNAAEALAEVGSRYIAFALDNPEIYRLMFGMKASEFNNNELIAGHMEGYCVLENVIDKGLQSSLLGDYPADDIALAAWSMVHGFASLLIDGIGELDPSMAQQQFKGMARVFLQGVTRAG